MNYASPRVSRFTSVLVSLSIVLGLFAFIKSALALEPILIDLTPPTISFSATPSETWQVYKGKTYDFSVKLVNLTQNTNVTVKAEVTGPLNTPQKATTLLETFVYDSDFTHVFKLNSLVNGSYLAAGDYELKVSAIESNNGFATETVIQPLTKNFQMTEEVNLSNISAPAEWIKGATNYSVGFSLETALPACVMLTVEGTVVSYLSAINSGDYHLNWDGKLNNQSVAVGDYDWKLDSDNTSFCASKVTALNLASGIVKVKELVAQVTPVPVIASLASTINPFSPNGDNAQDTTTVTFSLNTDSNLTVEVKNDKGVLVRTLKSNAAASAGTTNVVWNGKEEGGSVVPDGTYTVVVKASNQTGSDQETTNIVVDAVATPQPNNDSTCAGFKDLGANYQYCDEITQIKEAGVMTGHGDGTFQPDQDLSRDQILKIALTSHDKFNENLDYCKGVAPFPDVDKNAWSYQYACRALDLGIAKGYSAGVNKGKFVPSGGVNWVEFLALMLREFDSDMPLADSANFPQADKTQWYASYSAFAFQNDLFPGKADSFVPTAPVSRLEVAQVFARLVELGYIK